MNSFERLLAKLGSLRGKSVLVTGAASGIGKCTAQLFADAGARVAVVDTDQQRGEQAAAELRAGELPHIFIPADVRLAQDAERAVRQTAESFGGLDVLITSAGVVRPAGAEGNSAEEIRLMLEINFLGSVHFIQAATPFLRKNGGRIVCIGSVAGETLIANRDGYCASKAALHSWALTRAPELRRENIFLNIVAPGRVLTELVRGWVTKNENPDAAFRSGCSTQASGTMLLPEAVAEAVFFLASDIFPVTGTVLDLSDAWARGFQGKPDNLPESFEEFRRYAQTQLQMQGI
jgi:NAD(P)-dependent dehydrogenase (short-subunit alcohol dehydrogenase family)